MLQLLRLRQIHNAVFVKINKATVNMLRLVEPYVAWGYVLISSSSSFFFVLSSSLSFSFLSLILSYREEKLGMETEERQEEQDEPPFVRCFGAREGN